MSKRDNTLYLTDILDSINAILEFVKDMDYSQFSNDRKTYSAVLREFIVIGEAISKIDDELKEENKQIEWQLIKDFRNFIVHEYFGVDLEIVWDLIKNEILGLKQQINEVLNYQ